MWNLHPPCEVPHVKHQEMFRWNNVRAWVVSDPRVRVWTCSCACYHGNVLHFREGMWSEIRHYRIEVFILGAFLLFYFFTQSGFHFAQDIWAKGVLNIIWQNGHIMSCKGCPCSLITPVYYFSLARYFQWEKQKQADKQQESGLFPSLYRNQNALL